MPPELTSRRRRLAYIQTPREVPQRHLSGIFFRLVEINHIVPESGREGSAVDEDLGGPCCSAS
jgi:hypothetical protein